VSYNKDAQVAHVLGMVAHDSSLAEGSKSFAYDTIGTTEINTLGTMITNAIKQDSMRLGTSVSAFTEKFLYTPLGMKNSSWAGSVFAYSWTVDLLDMARVGVLINNYGMWSGERLVAAEWIYSQTHPSFEDANTGFGYLTWLNARSNWTSISGGKQQMAGTPGTCAPAAINKAYPHGASTSKDCGYTAPATCDQKYDIGVWNAEGLGGQLIQGHRGLDMVIVARDAQPGGTGPGTAKDVWDALRPAVIKGDPMFKGDEAAFCKAYGGNDYAPDLHM
jgi:CubicO group peptidase (beta-lactamase class C family)